MLGHVVSRILFPVLRIFRGKIISRWASNKLYFPGLMCSLLMLVFETHFLYFEIEEFFIVEVPEEGSILSACLPLTSISLLSFKTYRILKTTPRNDMRQVA